MCDALLSSLSKPWFGGTTAVGSEVEEMVDGVRVEEMVVGVVEEMVEVGGEEMVVAVVEEVVDGHRGEAAEEMVEEVVEEMVEAVGEEMVVGVVEEMVVVSGVGCQMTMKKRPKRRLALTPGQLEGTAELVPRKGSGDPSETVW